MRDDRDTEDVTRRRFSAVGDAGAAGVLQNFADGPREGWWYVVGPYKDPFVSERELLQAETGFAWWVSITTTNVGGG